MGGRAQPVGDNGLGIERIGEVLIQPECGWLRFDDVFDGGGDFGAGAYGEPGGKLTFAGVRLGYGFRGDLVLSNGDPSQCRGIPFEALKQELAIIRRIAGVPEGAVVVLDQVRRSGE